VNPLNPGAVDFDSADDIALADKMKHGRQRMLAELHKRIIGQGDVIELVLLTLAYVVAGKLGLLMAFIAYGRMVLKPIS